MSLPDRGSRPLRPGKEGHAASLRDVARLAGVSISTVSRALNAPGIVEPQTLLRVRDAIRVLRYVPQGAGRALRSRRSFTIGAIVPSLDNAFFSNATNALQEVLDRHGYTLLIASHRYDSDAEVRITRSLLERGAEGLVYVGADHDPEMFALLAQMSVPYVLTWAVDPSGRHPFVGFDNRAAMGRLARHLVDLGHREFGVISAPTAGNDRARERVLGVRATLQGHGLSLEPERLVELPISLSGGQEGMRRLLDGRRRPTAVICINDVLAVGAIAQCRVSGLAIPGDVSVAGFGDMEIAALHSPGITTVRSPTLEMGRAAADILVGRLEGTPVEAHVELEAPLVVRGSTVAPSALPERRRP